MIITEIDDSYKNEDVPNRWLALYTLQNLNRWPSKEIIKALKKRYPLDTERPVYRGMNFDTIEDWNSFVDELKQNNNQIKIASISSWTRSKGTANQFAVTRPTYYLNHSLMIAHDKMSASKERIIGYRGVIIQTTATPDDSIDVNKSNFSKEDEIILQPGTYQVQIIEQVKRFSDMIADGDESLETVLTKYLESKQQKQSNELYKNFYDYVLHHYSDEIKASEQFKEKIYEITISFLKANSSIDDMISVTIEEPYRFSRGVFEYQQVTVKYAPGIFIIAERGFLPASKKPLLQKYANKIISMYAQTLDKHSGPEYLYNLGGLRYLSTWASDKAGIRNLLNKQIGQVYNHMNSMENTRKINNIADPKERQKAINSYMDTIKEIISQYTKH